MVDVDGAGVHAVANGLDLVWNHLGHPGPASVEGIEMTGFALAIDLNLRSQVALPKIR